MDTVINMIRQLRQIRIMHRATMPPISSEIPAKMKSLSTTGISLGYPW